MTAHTLETLMIAGKGTPFTVAPRRNRNGILVSQGTSYLLVGDDDLEPLVEAMREVMGYA